MRAWRVTVAADDEDLATAALWEAGTAGVEVHGGARGARLDLLAYFADDASAAHSRPPPSGRDPRARRRCPTWTGWRASARASGPFAWAASSWRRPGTRRDEPSPERARRRSREGLRDRHPRDDPPLPRRARGPGRSPAPGPDARPRLGDRAARHRRRAPGRLSRLRLRHRPRGHPLLAPPRAPQRRPAGGRARRRRARPAGGLVRPRPREPDGPPARRPLRRDPLPARPRQARSSSRGCSWTTSRSSAKPSRPAAPPPSAWTASGAPSSTRACA